MGEKKKKKKKHTERRELLGILRTGGFIGFKRFYVESRERAKDKFGS